VVRWAGGRFSDFTEKFGFSRRREGGAAASYVSLATPDEEYFVGLDMASASHPQTLLCYEMNGRPLSLDHGAPLRLVTQLKYGIKQIKRIGTIRFTVDRPADYWAQRGYDWYAGH
jgi:DMSO/TMAO reductase YedYZ molybdopterin-dependent catalytic subunit